MKLLTGAAMREIDRRTISDIGVPMASLMENAGRAVADGVASVAGAPGSRPLVLLCGSGNNGGDGLVAARHLHNQGHRPRVLLLGSIAELRNDLVRAHARALSGWGIPVQELPDAAAVGRELPLPVNGVLVDALFGTGFRPPATGLAAQLIAGIERAHRRGAVVVAVDLPSGLDADTGRVSGPAVMADLTVTFAAPKVAHFSAPAEERCGRVEVADIGIPRSLIDDPAHPIDVVESSLVGGLLGHRRRDTHKGDYGHLLLVAGSRGKTGAAILAGKAALRAGAGLVTVATPVSCHGLVATGAPELMTMPLPETANGTIAAGAAGEILSALETCTALACGPGVTTEASAIRVAWELYLGAPRPAVFDADGLNGIADQSTTAIDASTPVAPRILTPHPGEAARLLDRTSRQIQDDRLDAVRTLVARFRGVVVLKGRRTLTALADGRIFLNPTGNPGLASAGTGDVLTGVIAGLVCQGLEPWAAAVTGVYLHGLAGDLASAHHGEAGLMASDVVDALGAARMQLAAVRDQHDA